MRRPAAGPHADGDVATRRRWWILGVLCLSLLVIGLDNTILNVALPTLVRELGASDSQLQWIIDAYILVFAGLLLTCGSLSDRFGRRRFLGIGLLVFGAGSVASAFASSASVLIGTRAMMGAGAALIMPPTLSILTNTFPERERGRAIGIWAGVMGLGIGIGPLVGGWLLTHFWWGSVFLVNVPVVIVAFVAGRLIVPESKDPSAPPLDPVGLVLSVVGLVSLVYAIIEAPSHGWTDPVILACFALAGVVLACFVPWELASDHPMLNVRFFENPRFSASNVAVTLVFFALLGSLFMLTQYLQFVLGYTPLQAGIRITPVAIVMIVVAPLTGLLVRPLGNKVLVTSGLVVVAVGLALLSRTTVADRYLDVLPQFIVLVVGMSLAMTPATESIMGAIPKEKAGVGSAMNDTTRQVGGALGVAVIGSIFSSAYASGFGRSLAVAPAPIAAEIRSSVGGALAVAKAIGGSTGMALVRLADASFIHAMDRALGVAAVVALGGAIVALVWLPNRARPPTTATGTHRRLQEEPAPRPRVADRGGGAVR